MYRTSLKWEKHGFIDSYFESAAHVLVADRIIAWFAGGMEFGPRALGNRSILALLSGRDIKDRLNKAVKLRESYRPFAPAVLDTDYAELFEEQPLDPCRYMLCIARTARASTSDCRSGARRWRCPGANRSEGGQRDILATVVKS
ncbi:carbamoyltransferase C-terminal domain-containing protein [Rhodococcus erythropolis]|nr:carbamoyltransferase C-terminal domain-containing protein [Rhodococcus erythropolis]